MLCSSQSLISKALHPLQVRSGVLAEEENQRLWVQKGGSRQMRNNKSYLPSLIAHAPRLPHTALLPNFNHACEGLHTWLPLGDQRHLLLRTHIGPGKKKRLVKKYLTWQDVEQCFHRCTDDSRAIYEHLKRCCGKDRRETEKKTCLRRFLIVNNASPVRALPVLRCVMTSYWYF